ncbi:virulence factor Mce family protein [[Mycobacterium] wendilense]|uniref:Virulence factor Mce family protein n=1 Tax=[Mycobacterium] wendilense TaxID=3064284 RepID=A0ABN9P0F4_9MYCO|nr:virulence factor Mce family protein [Mycolicibacterium sp. MU0050]CAJ1581073.1 virulence factor Mce family protein [Mycolicibacterium sp. MU0050]
MKDNLSGATWRLAAFLVVCAMGTFALLMIFAELRFYSEKVYRAEFIDASGLERGEFVRIAGVEVGKVKSIEVGEEGRAHVEFSTADSVVLTDGTRAAIRWADMIGGRYLSLEPAAGSVQPLEPGATIPVERTAPALDLDALIGGFRPLFRALNPDQVNALSSQLIQAFQGQGATIGSLLQQTAQVTMTLADRDQLIGDVITNLNTVLGSFASESEKLDESIDSLSQLIEGLNARKADLSNAVAHIDGAAGTIADLLAQARPPLQRVVEQTDRTAGLVVADHEYFDDLLNTLPDVHQLISRQGIYGDFFSFYMCDVVLKLNGKGGQPVYVKVAGQDTGRCEPK